MINTFFSYFRFRWFLRSCIRNGELCLFKYYLYYFIKICYIILIVRNAWPQESLNRRYEEKILINLRSKNFFNHFIYSLVLLIKMITILYLYLWFKWFLWSCIRNDELYILKFCSYYFVPIYFTFHILLFLHHNIRII
jgi:hypothetical protein